ncbi:MAG: class II aldolase/adducin family protein [Chthoniobacterales bacterium]
MSETGAVKFRCEQIPVKLDWFPGFDELNACRRKLRELGLIGVDANEIGYGNLSVRNGATQEFYITGSGTGYLAELTPADCAKVVWYDLIGNAVRCEGVAVASSESLTHAAVYESDPHAAAVIHCHSAALWNRLLDLAPTTAPEVEYGTPAMAFEVQRLFERTNVKELKIFVMAGHEEGIAAFGASIEEAFDVLLRHGLAPSW